MSKKITALIPGAALALGIACIAKWLETLESSAGLHLIGASVIALFIGMAINAFFQPNKTTAPGIKFTSKKVLKFAIVLLGASLNIRTVLTVGRFSLTVMLFTLATCFGLGALIGRALGLNWKTSSLINAGTGICGGSAIAAIAPVIEADDMDIAYGMSATFLFDTVMIVVFPLLGRRLCNDGQADPHAGDHSGCSGLCRHQPAPEKERACSGQRCQGAHPFHFPLVHPCVPCHVPADQSGPSARRAGFRPEDHQQVSDGRGPGGHRSEHEL